MVDKMDILVGELLQAHDEFGQLLELYMRRGEVHVPGDSIRRSSNRKDGWEILNMNSIIHRSDTKHLLNT